MDLKRLFHVLVLGGSVAGGCEQRGGAGLGAAGSTGQVGGRTGGGGSGGETGSGGGETGGGGSGGETGGGGATGGGGGAGAGGSQTTDAGVARDATPEGPAGSPCLCSPTRCCDQHEGAPATVQAGLVCCWGTSC